MAKDELAVPNTHNRRLTVNYDPPQAMRIPPKIINEIRFLKSSVDKHDKLVQEMGEKVYVNDRILSRINDYYESNLRNTNLKHLSEQMKDLEKTLEYKENKLEVKKVASLICNNNLF